MPELDKACSSLLRSPILQRTGDMDGQIYEGYVTTFLPTFEALSHPLWVELVGVQLPVSSLRFFPFLEDSLGDSEPPNTTPFPSPLPPAIKIPSLDVRAT